METVDPPTKLRIFPKLGTLNATNMIASPIQVRNPHRLALKAGSSEKGMN